MKKFFLILLIALSTNSFAQDLPDSVLQQGWNWAGVVGLNLSQTSFVNWSQGGSNSLAFSLYTNIGAVYVADPWKVRNRLSVIYGRTKLETEGYRTTDNDIYYELVTIRHINWAVDPFFAFSFRSAITKGFDYSVTPDTQIVDFFDPGYLTQTVGFTYEKGKVFRSRLGVGIQETFASAFPKYTDDPETPEIETFKLDTGIESVTEVNYEFLPNMNYYSFLRLFSSFNALDVWDVRWENLITAKINNYFNVNLSVTVVHQVSQSLKTQMRENLQLGFQYSLF